MITYGDLVGQAAGDMHVGLIQVLRDGFDSQRQARNVIGANYDVLCALRSHMWTLIDPLHVRYDLLLDQAGAEEMDLDRTAVGLFTSIRAINPRRVETPYPDFDFAHPWLDSSRRLGAASDLLATHYGNDFSPRSEYAQLALDARARTAALGAVATLTEVALAAHQPLGLRAREAGVPWEALRQWLPDVQEPLRRSRQLRQLVGSSTSQVGLAEIPLNDRTVRVGDPIEEISDRLARIRHAAWTLAARPEHAMGTLRDLAGLGVAVHAHAAVLHGVDIAPAVESRRGRTGSPVAPSATASATSAILAGGRAWQRVGADLQHYIAPAVPDPGIREDVIESCQLLNDLVPLRRPNRLAGFDDPVTRRYAAIVNGAIESMTRVAEWNARTFAAMGKSGAVQVRTADLTGEEVTDKPELVTAKLQQVPRVSAPEVAINRTVALYHSVGSATTRMAPASSLLHGSELAVDSTLAIALSSFDHEP